MKSESELGKHDNRGIGQNPRHRGQSLFSAGVHQERILRAKRYSQHLPLERACELLQFASWQERQQRCSVVLSRAKGTRQIDQKLRRILARSEDHRIAVASLVAVHLKLGSCYGGKEMLSAARWPFMTSTASTEGVIHR